MTTGSTTLPVPSTGNLDDHEYDSYLQTIQARFDVSVAANPTGLFTTDVDNLFAIYVEGLPEEYRQYSQCNACRRFFATYAGLVLIDNNGITWSPMWDAFEAPLFYQPAIKNVVRAIKRAKITGVFCSDKAVWGEPRTGAWTHYAITPVPQLIFKHPLLTPFQKMAEKVQDYQTLKRALEEFTPSILTTAAELLRSNALYRSERVLGVGEWLLGVQNEIRAGVDETRRDNVLWRAVATAPTGYCHPRSSMIGTLLSDLADGLDYAEVNRRFSAKMDPMQYQRPQAPPTAGNIRQAEQVVEKLGVAASLQRRFARLDDLETLWMPAPPKEPLPVMGKSGVFHHLFPHAEQPKQTVVAPPQTMTWDKFARTVLPTATRIDYYVPVGNTSFTALVTAADPEAPRIFQWDNPVSWYMYNHGSQARHWGLTAATYCPVTAITLQPSMWGDPSRVRYPGQGVIFVLHRACDTRYQSAGSGIFPEFLRSEFHSIRATIEAFSKRATIAGAEQASACGIGLKAGDGTWGSRFRVTSNTGMVAEYTLDRWD